MHHQISEAVDTVAKKYEQLVDGYLKSIAQMEESLAVLQNFNDLVKSHQDSQKQIWDSLSGHLGKFLPSLSPRTIVQFLLDPILSHL